MAFNMFSPSNFNLGGPPVAPQGGAQAAAPANGRLPTQQEEFQFYSTLFNVLDTEKKQALSGGQVFNFFLSSKLTKNVLADIWDAVKQNGVLVVRSFVSAMKLITLAQKGIKPELANLNNFQFVGPPDLQYPPNTRLLAPVGLLVQGQGQQGAAPKQNGGADPFSSFDLGFTPASAASKPVSKPSGPNWVTDEIPSNTNGPGGKNTAQSSPNVTGLSGQSFPSSMSIGIGVGTVANAVTGVTGATGATTGGMTPVGGSGSAGVSVGAPIGIGNQYGPSAILKTTHTRQSTRTLAHDAPDYASGDEASGQLPALGRVTSRRLFEDERSREELRAANQREKMARQQLNDARITNEKIERENEALRAEIREAREAQANALKQSSEALSAIQPLRVENEKLKEAIREWQELIRTKDTDIEQLETELEEIRAENEKYKIDMRQIREEMDNLAYEVDSLKSKFEESEKENKRHLREISTLKDEKLRAESEKRDLDIEIVKMQAKMKNLEREVKQKATQQEAKRRESDLFNSFGNGFGPGSSGPDSNRGRARRSTTGSHSRSPMQKAVGGPPIDAIIGNNNNNNNNKNDFDTKASKTEDLFSGLSHSPPIKEEKNKGNKDEFDDFGGDTAFPEMNFDDNPPPPANLNADDMIDIGNGAIAPPSERLAMQASRRNIGGIGGGSGTDTGADDDDDMSEYEEVEVETTEMEEYEVKEKKLITVPKDVIVSEVSDIEINVSSGDVTDGVYSGQETYGSSDWFLSLKLFNGNRKHFINSDQDKDGKLNVKEAWAFFQLAKMDAKVLQQAWKLVATSHNDPDLPKDGLSEIQFHCMFQIILTMKKKGLTDCPKEIPDALKFDVIRMLGKPVINGKVTVRKTTNVTRSEPVQEEQFITVKKQRPVTKMTKKRVKKGNASNALKKDSKGKSKGKGKNKNKKKVNDTMASASNEPPPLPADANDDFGFGNDAPGASTNNNNTTKDDFGGFDDFGDFGNNDKKASKPAKSKKDEFIADDDFGQPGNTVGDTPGNEEWEDFGTDW